MTSTLDRSRRKGGEESKRPSIDGGIDPRIAARRDAVTADRRRRIGRRLLAVVVVLVVVAAGWFLTRTPLLDVDRIEVRGVVQTQVDDVADASGIRTGEPLLEVDPGASAARVRALPWIDTATVRRQWDGLVIITVTERDFVAVVVDANGVGQLVDASGRVLAPDGPFDMVDTVIAGAVAGEPGSTVEGYDDALAVAALLTPGMRSRISTITVAPDGTIQLGLRPQGTVQFGPPTDLAAKVASLRTVMAQVDQRDLASVNVVNPSTPVVVRTPK